MIDDVVAVLRPEYDRDHVLADKLLSFRFALGTPALALLLDLPNADRHLGRAQVCDRNGLDNGFAKRHGGLLLFEGFITHRYSTRPNYATWPRREGPHRLPEKRPRSFVSALRGFAAVEMSRNHLSRDFRGRSIFDFCNTIRRRADICGCACRGPSLTCTGKIQGAL